MNKQELAYKLQSLDFNRPEEFETLAEEISRRSREEVDLVVKTWKENEKNLGDKAEALLMDLHDVTIVSLLNAGAPSLPMQRARGMAIMVKGQIYRRERIVTYLVKLLVDKEMLPEVIKYNRSEEARPVIRVCDEAYLQLRKLLNTSESDDTYLQNASVYLHMDFEERDEEIGSARASGVWDRWMDVSDSE